MKKEKQANNQPKPGRGPWIFMFISLFLFFPLYLADKEKAALAMGKFVHLAMEILPMLLVVFVLMALINIFLKTSTMVKYMGKGSGIKGWFIAIVAGILSVGALYLWYPVLRNLMQKGVKPGLAAAFLYNRGIKLPWLPLMVLYFGLKYVIVLTAVTVVVSILQGVIIDFLITEEGGDESILQQ